MIFIAPIVEGQGEVQAVPTLLRRIVAASAAGKSITVNPPIRVKSGSFLKDDDYFGRYLAMAAAKARQHPAGHVLVMLDCEDDCPARLGPDLLRRARRVADDVPIIVALARREYETWFVAAARSLRGVQGLSPDAEPPSDPEATRDAKGWLGRLMPHPYDPIADQLPFTRAFDLQSARGVASFDRLYRKLAAIAAAST